MTNGQTKMAQQETRKTNRYKNNLHDCDWSVYLQKFFTICLILRVHNVSDFKRKGVVLFGS